MRPISSCETRAFSPAIPPGHRLPRSPRPNGRITAVGDEADVAALIGPGTRVIDALGRRVIPGLNDSHIHLIRGGVNYLLELRWDGVPSLSVALQMLREQSERTPAGQWVRVVGGWSGAQFAEKRLPTVSELNAAAPDTPVLVLHLYQSAILNRAAVAALGYTKDTPDPPGGQIVRDHAGNPTGVLLAAPAPFILYGALGRLPVLDPDQQLSSTRHFFRELNRFGITSAIDAAGGSQQFPDNYAAVMQLADSGELSVRIAYHLLPQTAGQELQDLTRWVETMRIGDGNEWLRLNGAGEALTLSSVDFENFCEPRPELPGTALDEVEQAVRILVSNDWGFRLHASYGETIDRFLGIFDKLAAEGLFPNGNRWFFDHAETVSPRALERISRPRRRRVHPEPHHVPVPAVHRSLRASGGRKLASDPRHARCRTHRRGGFRCHPRGQLQPVVVTVLARHRHRHRRATVSHWRPTWSTEPPRLRCTRAPGRNSPAKPR